MKCVFMLLLWNLLFMFCKEESKKVEKFELGERSSLESGDYVRCI